MPFNSNWNRRGFLSTLGIIVTAAFSPFKLAAKKSPASAAGRVSGFGQTGNPYEENRECPLSLMAKAPYHVGRFPAPSGTRSGHDHGWASLREHSRA